MSERRAFCQGDRLLTADQVADRIGTTPAWVYQAAHTGGIPHVRLGRYVRFRCEALIQWLVDIEAR